ncbi:hypothetical protein ZEAMMB73_Zm00001d013944 [Zea mays]|uniref:Protein arginine N-methyltransferase domain-containing protein n=1 Tax=Zea mays TaxID=4577 RepID=A0A1D6GNR2_MAIZE|nr:hypothetical protein ZEAMMB73_Zm00001d013944 [Zea mays]
MQHFGLMLSSMDQHARNPRSNLVNHRMGTPKMPAQVVRRKKPDVSVVLSTAPEDAPIHWQQTLLYLFGPIELNKDQIIEGSVIISQSQQHARFLNICLEYFTGDQWYVKESVMR